MNSRPTLIVVVAFVLSGLGSIGFAFAYVAGAGAQWEGIALAIGFAGIAFGLLVWGTRVLPPEQVTDHRDDYPSPEPARKAAEAAFETGKQELSRRGLLVGWVSTAFALLGIAILFPIRSLGPGLSRGLVRTKWTPGARVVQEDGTPIRAGDLAIDSLLTVFPEGFVGDASSQTLLLRLRPGTLHASQQRSSWSPQGYVAFSKVCTHAGCPVGLYRAASYQLLCPCHQSVFDVVNGAQPISGPAARPLPQLPLTIAPDGWLRAQSDYQEPIGPGFWERA